MDRCPDPDDRRPSPLLPLLCGALLLTAGLLALALSVPRSPSGPTAARSSASTGPATSPSRWTPAVVTRIVVVTATAPPRPTLAAAIEWVPPTPTAGPWRGSVEVGGGETGRLSGASTIGRGVEE